MPFGQLKRRDFIMLLGVVAACPATATGEQTPKRPVIGFLAPGAKTTGSKFYSGFSDGMQELGYIEGRDYVLEMRYAESNLGRLPALAHELVRLKPDVIVAATLAGAHAAQQASDRIPIVGINLTDPVGMGLVKSEARPGTNVTGTLVRLHGLTGKLLEIARDLLPGATKI
jgi:putative ABC transport system substrate-binding protein